MPAPRSAVRLLVAGLLLPLASPGLAEADKPRVGVTPFLGGAQAKVAEKVVKNALAARYEVVAQGAAGKGKGKGKGKAKASRHARGKRGRHGVATAAAAPAAATGGSDVVAVIDGAILKRRKLLIAVKNTADGNVSRLSWPINGSISRSTFERIATEVPAAVDTLLGAGGSAPTPSAPTAAGSTSGTPGTTAGGGAVTIDPLTGAPVAAAPTTTTPAAAPVEPGPSGGARPAWAPYLDAGASFLLTERRFSFSQPTLPGFTSGLNSGVRGDLTLFPFAGTSRGSAASRALGGLGVGASGEYHFRPDSTPSPCKNLDGSGACVDKYPTTEYRYQFGLRWRWNIAGRDDRPDLRASVEYGGHHFGIARRTATRADNTTYQTDVGPPDVDYRYLSIGLGTRVPFAGRLAVEAGVDYQALLDLGPVGSPAGYGAFGGSGGWGIRGRLAFEVRVAAGLHLGVHGFYERLALSFTAPPEGRLFMTMPPCGEPQPCGTTGGATDQYFGGGATLSYRY